MNCDEGEDEESSEENFWGSDFSYSSENDEDEDEDCHDSDLDDDDDIKEYELNGSDESRRKCNGVVDEDERILDESTEKKSWKQVVNEKMRIEWKGGGKKQLKEDEKAENGRVNVYHVEEQDDDDGIEVTSGNHEKTLLSSSSYACSYSSSSRNSITSTSTCSSSTPTLIKYRKLSQRPKDQPPPP